MLSHDQRFQLVDAARAAAARAFLTNQSGTTYGAAVLTVLGKVYQAGQYSSFNHVTNIHAEQAVLLIATMADDPDVLALAIASNGTEPITRPCGICRQVLAEHSARVGRDFEVLMACRDSNSYETALVSELLPLGWSPGQNRTVVRDVDVRSVIPQQGLLHKNEVLEPGDHIILRDGCVAMVWDSLFEPAGTLVKLKYAPCEGKLRKVPHSFSDPLRYQKELHDLGWIRQAKCGIHAPVIGASEVSNVLKTLQLGKEIGEPPGPLISILRDVGVNVAGIRVTGSRAIGLQRADSDWDLIVPVDANQLPLIREKLAAAVESDMLTVPLLSGTWKLIDRIFPGGRHAALSDRRFADTLLSGGTAVALMFLPHQSNEFCVGHDWIISGRTVLHGKVLRASRAAYKRSEYELKDNKGVISIICFHKAANLLRVGDVVSVCGWIARRGNERRLIQILHQPDRILWWEVATGDASEE
ncbi:MAG: hypothetical protein R3B84_14055 [Zavarzinella sp.]